MGIVISAYPACGKTYAFEHQRELGYKILDSDSSKFSWIEKDGIKERNPDFPQNYIEHIKKEIDNYDFIFVSSHLKVREALTNAGIRFVTVYPDNNAKNEWIGRMYCRGNHVGFLKFQNENWDKFVNDIDNEPHGDYIIRLRVDKYITDWLSYIRRYYYA